MARPLAVYLDAIRRAIWRIENVPGERVTTEALLGGGARITIELKPNEVLDVPAPKGDPKALGSSVGAAPPKKK